MQLLSLNADSRGFFSGQNNTCTANMKQHPPHCTTKTSRHCGDKHYAAHSHRSKCDQVLWIGAEENTLFPEVKIQAAVHKQQRIVDAQEYGQWKNCKGPGTGIYAQCIKWYCFPYVPECQYQTLHVPLPPATATSYNKSNRSHHDLPALKYSRIGEPLYGEHILVRNEC